MQKANIPGVKVSERKIKQISRLLRGVDIPPEEESDSHSFSWKTNIKLLANAYLAIVAICHQTSPYGEKKLEGCIGGVRKRGWDYLKEKFLKKATEDKKWASFRRWQALSPIELSNIYRDNIVGITLSRINERTFLLNELGAKLLAEGYTYIEEAFEKCNRILGGKNGFLNFLRKFQAYKDPVNKKAFYFLSIVKNECNWEIVDIDALSSPVDYHELRGHLRIGTISIINPELRYKLNKNLPFTIEEDTELRSLTQEINSRIARTCGVESTVLHYLLWNIFRNCCDREPSKTHCHFCENCYLPTKYKSLRIYNERCIFSEICDSSDKEDKVLEPPFIGHYY